MLKISNIKKRETISSIYWHFAWSEQNEILDSDNIRRALCATTNRIKIQSILLEISHKSIFTSRHFDHISVTSSHPPIFTKFEPEIDFMMIELQEIELKNCW